MLQSWTKGWTQINEIKGAEATSVEIVTEMKKCLRLKDMLNFIVLWGFSMDRLE